MKFCINCGVQLKDSAKFCPRCGFKQELELMPEEEQVVLKEEDLPATTAVQRETSVPAETVTSTETPISMDASAPTASSAPVVAADKLATSTRFEPSVALEPTTEVTPVQPVEGPLVTTVVASEATDAVPATATSQVIPASQTVQTSQVTTARPNVQPSQVGVGTDSTSMAQSMSADVKPQTGAPAGNPHSTDSTSQQVPPTQAIAPSLDMQGMAEHAKSYWKYFKLSLKNPDRLHEDQQMWRYSIVTFSLYLMGLFAALWQLIVVTTNNVGRGVGITDPETAWIRNYAIQQNQKQISSTTFQVLLLVILLQLTMVATIWLVRRYLLREVQLFKQTFVEYSSYLAPLVVGGWLAFIIAWLFDTQAVPIVLFSLVGMMQSLIPALMVQKGYKSTGKVAAYYAIAALYPFAAILGAIVLMLVNSLFS